MRKLKKKVREKHAKCVQDERSYSQNKLYRISSTGSKVRMNTTNHFYSSKLTK